MRATLIADDLTGACDAGAPFAGRGPVGVFISPASPGPEWSVAVVDTESRGRSPADARDAVRAAASRLGARFNPGLLFKKIDSTLRGPTGAEVDALLAASGRRTALLCPAFPGQGRMVVNGVLLVNGTRAHESSIARDPTYPGPTSDVAEIIRRGTARSVSRLPLHRVRGDADALAMILRDAKDQIVVADALTDGDLAALACATLHWPEMVLAGSAGLAGAVAEAYGHAGAPAPLPGGRAWLIVAGSAQPATRAQLRSLEAGGVLGARLDAPTDPDTGPLVERLKGGHPVFIATSDTLATGLDARRATGARLAALAARILTDSRPDLIAVTGGETATALLHAIGATRLEVSGAPSNGLALVDAIVDSTSKWPLLTKAGGFGPPDLFTSLLAGHRS